MNTEAGSLSKDNGTTQADSDQNAAQPFDNDSKSGSLPWYAWAAIGVLLLVLVGGLAVWRLRPPEFHGVLIQSPDKAPDFTLMSTTGEPVSLSDFRGKEVMLYFGYTFCPDVCPTTLNDLKVMMQELGPKKAENVQVIMVSVDPERDTVEQLSTYLPYFHPDFLGMTGDIADISDIASQFGIFFQREEGDTAAGYLVDHTAVVTLVDDKGYIKMIFPYGTTGQEMAADVAYFMR